MNDPYLWLEDRNGGRAVQWAQDESALAKKVFEGDPRFAQTKNEIFSIMNAEDKLPMVSLFEGMVYNFWQDAQHKRGLWRRATLAEYKKAQPQWEVLLDIDALAAKEKEPWTFHGVVRQPGADRVLVSLSRNAQDASEMREFSMSQKAFVKGGFTLPESKSNFAWVDKDHLLVAAAFSEDQKTTSGYARMVYFWKRGEDFSKAKKIFEVLKSDNLTWVSTNYAQGKKYIVLGRSVSFDTVEYFFLNDLLETKKLPLPLDTEEFSIAEGQIFVSVRSEWKGHKPGTLMSLPLSVTRDYATPEEIPASLVKVVFAPTATSALMGFAQSENRIYIAVNENVLPKVYEIHSSADGNWKTQPILASSNSVYISALDPWSDSMMLQEEGDLQPRRLVLHEKGSLVEVKTTRDYFDTTSLVTEQHWVKSKDGTKIPYRIVRSKNISYDGSNPTLLYGYGGFLVPLTPKYIPSLGKAWLEKGGVYVSANIRGGGEFGPEWHKAAMLEKKQNSYDDFIAVAEDLIARKITSPAHLGIQGGSNGGLLVGAVAMQRPDLFAAVVCQIPLLDMLRYTKLPPGASWASEYGDPDDPKFHEIISKYSPYQNISKTKKYPKIFFQTTQADDRVHPGHARKMAARMKEYGHDVYFIESTDGGHGGGGVELEDQAKSSAHVYVYLYQQLK